MRTAPSSAAVFRATGAFAVAEPAALLAAKQGATLLVPKMKWPNVTTAVAPAADNEHANDGAPT